MRFTVILADRRHPDAGRADRAHRCPARRDASPTSRPRRKRRSPRSRRRSTSRPRPAPARAGRRRSISRPRSPLAQRKPGMIRSTRPAFAPSRAKSATSYGLYQAARALSSHRPDGDHDHHDGDELEQHAQPHQPLRGVGRAAAHHVARGLTRARCATAPIASGTA